MLDLGQALKAYVTQHSLLSPSAPSLTFNIAIMILVGVIAAVLGREDELARELSRIEVLEKMIQGYVCYCMCMNMCVLS